MPRNVNVDRYKIIRNFFRKQYTVAPQTLILSSRRLPKATRPEVVHRSFRPSILRPFPTPENSQKKHQKPAPTPPNSKSELDPPPPIRNIENYSRFFQRLALSLPHLHRPTRDDFLKVATGFWERMRIRFKWFTIKSFRKFNADDISAFITWFVMSQTLWILVGT